MIDGARHDPEAVHVALDVEKDLVVVRPKSASDHRLPVVCRIPCEADARRDVVRIGPVVGVFVAALTAGGKKTRRMRDCPSAAALLAEIDVAAVFIDVLDEPDWSDCAGLARVAAEHATPVIVVTGWVAPDARFRKRAFDAGCAAFIAKPCTALTLLTTLERVAAGEGRIEVVAHRKLA